MIHTVLSLMIIGSSLGLLAGILYTLYKDGRKK